MTEERIKNNIRRCRFDRDQMTQQQLAEKAGVTRQTIIAIEQGRYSPSLPLAIRLARIFNKQVEEIFILED
jgi:putative transcriptional regulator